MSFLFLFLKYSASEKIAHNMGVLIYNVEPLKLPLFVSIKRFLKQESSAQGETYDVLTNPRSQNYIYIHPQ